MADIPNKQKLEKAQAIIALAADKSEAKGEKPTLEEIVAWHEKRMDEPRASEVKAHIARDPEAYQMWFEYREANQQFSKESSNQVKSKTSWKDSLSKIIESIIPTAIKPSYGVAGIAASVAGFMLVIPMFLGHGLEQRLDSGYSNWSGEVSAENWMWDQAMMPKSLLPFSAPDVSQQAFQNGFREGLSELTKGDSEWKTRIEQIHLNESTCSSEDEACIDFEKLNLLAGRWAALSYLQCQTQNIDLNEALGFIENISEEMENLALGGKVPNQFKKWSQITPNNETVYCKQLTGLINTGLNF